MSEDKSTHSMRLIDILAPKEMHTGDVADLLNDMRKIALDHLDAYQDDDDDQYRELAERIRSIGICFTVQDLWLNNGLQFPRLLAEIEAAGGFTPELLSDLRESMDLEDDEIFQLVNRAQKTWDEIKENI